MSDATAIHEAGHVVMLIRTGGRLKWVKLTDDPRSSEDGRCRAESDWTHDASVAGHFAERRWMGSSRSAALSAEVCKD
jgi:hypothetical protein